MQGVFVTQTNKLFSLINSQDVAAQIGHHQGILEEYTNWDGIHINYSASIKLC
jgi:hypothetical protein